MKNKKAFFVYLIISALLWQFCATVSDIVTKFSFKSPLFSISKVINKGAAFGLFEGAPYILGVFGIFVFVFVSIYVYKNFEFKDKFQILNASVFSAGILGNTYERLTSGFVKDFINLNFIDFPVFNFFDILITTSVFLYILFFIKEEFKNEN